MPPFCQKRDKSTAKSLLEATFFGKNRGFCRFGHIYVPFYQICEDAKSRSESRCIPLAERVTGAATTTLGAQQDALVHQITQVTASSVLRAVVYLVPFRRREFTLKSIKQHVEHLALAVIEQGETVFVPKLHLDHHTLCLGQSLTDGPIECVHEPQQPGRDIQPTLLCSLEVQSLRWRRISEDKL